MPTVNPNPLLETPSAVAIVEIALRSSFPLQLGQPGGGTPSGFGALPFGSEPFGHSVPAISAFGDDPTLDADLNAPPVRWSTIDTPTPRGQAIGRLVEHPAFTLGRDGYSISECTLAVHNVDGALSSWLRPTIDVRGKSVELGLYDWASGTLAWPVFRGRIAAIGCRDNPWVILVTCLADDLAASARWVPWRTITTGDFPRALSVAGATGGLGATVPVGIGRGRNIPARLCEGPRTANDPRVWRAIPAMGTAAIQAVRYDGGLLTPWVDYTVEHRQRVHGRVATVLRLTVPPYRPGTAIPVAITADIDRRFLDVSSVQTSGYTWAGAGWWDWVGRHHATPTAGLTTGAIVTGRSGFGLGAVRFTNGGGVTFPPTAWRRTTGTWAFEVRIPSAGLAPQCLLMSAGRTIGSTTAGWEIWLTATDTLEWRVRYAGGALITLSIPTLARNIWHTIACTADYVAPTTTLRLAHNGDLLEDPTEQTKSVTGILAYDPTITGLGDVARAGGATVESHFYPVYDLGWVGTWDSALPTASLERLHAVLTRSPVEGLREFGEEAGDVADEVTARTETVRLAAAANGVLAADGWVTDPAQLGAIADRFGVFRELAPRWDADAVMRFASYAEPPATVDLSIDVGPPRSNATLRQRVRRSTAEVTSVVPIRYRQQRGPDGQTLSGPFGAFAYEVQANTGMSGDVGQPLECPFVDDHHTADAIRDWVEKIQPIEDVRTDVTTGHEGRLITRNALVRVNLAAHGVTDADHRVIQVGHKIHAVDLVLVPFSAVPHAYTPTPEADLPHDTTAETIATMDTGDAHTLIVSAPPPGGRTVLLDAFLDRRHRAYPARALIAGTDPAFQPGVTISPVGLSLWEALDEANNSTGSVTISVPPVGSVFVRLTPTRLALSSFSVSRVAVVMRARWVSGAPVFAWPWMVDGALTMTRHPSDVWRISDATSRDWASSWVTHPTAGTAWSLGLAAEATPALELGVDWEAGVTGVIRLEWAAFDIYQALSLPDALGTMRAWRVERNDPAVPSRRPDPSVYSLGPWVTLTGHTDTVPGPGTFDYFASIYDTFGRVMVELPVVGDPPAVAVVT